MSLNELPHETVLEQIAAGMALVRKSGLLRLDAKTLTFSVVEEEAFESSARTMHIRFGRVMKWLLFAVGAEYLLRGVMVLRELPKPKSNTVGKWNDEWRGLRACGPDVSDDEHRQLTQAFRELTRIRNRDAHVFVPNQRQLHYYMVSSFAPALNHLVRTYVEKRHYEVIRTIMKTPRSER